MKHKATKLLFFVLLVFNSNLSQAQMKVDTSLSAAQLIDYFMGEGVSVFNIKYKGDAGSIAYFKMDSVDFPMSEGIVLSTGRANSIKSQNVYGNMSTSKPKRDVGDADLRQYVYSPIYNTTILEFDFIPIYDSLFFEYVFASEEYPEYVGSLFNDLFCLLIEGGMYKQSMNLARVGQPSTMVSVNSVNHKKNSDFFIANYDPKRERRMPYTIEFDGFTTTLTASCRVLKGKKHHLKIVIGNVNDFSYDSGVFLKANSFGTSSTSGGSGKISIPFDFNSAEVSGSFYSLMDSLGNLLKSNPPMKLTIVGHTDSVGTKVYNDTLSLKRAEEIKAILINKGASQKQITVKGYGFDKPIRSNSSEEGREKNRRVELYFIEKK